MCYFFVSISYAFLVLYWFNVILLYSDLCSVILINTMFCIMIYLCYVVLWYFWKCYLFLSSVVLFSFGLICVDFSLFVSIRVILFLSCYVVLVLLCVILFFLMLIFCVLHYFIMHIYFNNYTTYLCRYILWYLVLCCFA